MVTDDDRSGSCRPPTRSRILAVDVWISAPVKREPASDAFTSTRVARLREGVMAAAVRAEFDGAPCRPGAYSDRGNGVHEN